MERRRDRVFLLWLCEYACADKSLVAGKARRLLPAAGQRQEKEPLGTMLDITCPVRHTLLTPQIVISRICLQLYLLYRRL